MPFFHDQDRSGLRRHYVEAWRKHRAGTPLEPLEHQLATVIEQHPEYHPLFEGDEQALGRDYTPESGQSNPFLHLGLHLAIREQVATDRPAGIAALHASCRAASATRTRQSTACSKSSARPSGTASARAAHPTRPRTSNRCAN